MKVALKCFIEDIIQHYSLGTLQHNGYIFIKIKKRMYGLKQAVILAYHSLSKLLTNGGYEQILDSLRMWKHKTRKTLFCLCVDDFGVRYYSKEDVQQLHDIITE